MVGIVSYGAYIPRYRMTRKTISSSLGWLNPPSMDGEKAVANYDEDSISMAVSASLGCLEGADRDLIDCLYFATTTAPYREREAAAIIATALNLGVTVRTADMANSLKAGTGAFLASCESVKSGGARQALVCAADCRLGKPRSYLEMVSGDGGAALLTGSENVIASLEGCYSVSYDFPDHWRLPSDKFDRTLEDRWIRDEGYTKFISQAIAGVLKKCGLTSKDLAKVVYPCLYPRDHAGIGRELGFNPSQIQEPLLTAIGDTGNASPLLMVIAALEKAKPGDNIVVASYGNGSDALLLRVTEEIEKKRNSAGLGRYLGRKKILESYERYLVFRGLLPIEEGLRGEVGHTQLPLAWRDRKAILGLVGSRCKRCGTPQYPPQNVCVNPGCGAIGQMEDYRFGERKGTLFSFTEDRLAATMNPPEAYGMIDFEKGGRYIFDITDYEPGSLEVGMPVEMTFRRKYVDEVRGIHMYFWKARPAEPQKEVRNA